jgi:hypothetical protein
MCQKHNVASLQHGPAAKHGRLMKLSVSQHCVSSAGCPLQLCTTLVHASSSTAGEGLSPALATRLVTAADADWLLCCRCCCCCPTVVPPGYYLKGPGQVSPCPKGEWKAGFGAVASCSKCAPGVSTESEASTSRTACVVVLPTFYPSARSQLGIVTETQLCPQKYFCPGGKATAAFDPELPGLDGTTMMLCKFGLWTQEIGASSADQCSK